MIGRPAWHSRDSSRSAPLFLAGVKNATALVLGPMMSLTPGILKLQRVIVLKPSMASAHRPMDALTLLSILWRRWFVVLPIAILTAAAGIAVAASPDVRYETYGSELLVTRSQTGGQTSTVPSLSADLVSSFVADSLLTPEFELELREAGFTSDFEVTANPDSSLITVTVTGGDPSDVFEMTETIIDRAPAATESFLGSDVAAAIDLSPLTPTTRDQIVESEDSFALSVPLAASTKAATVSNPFPVGASTMLTLGEIASRKELANSVQEEVPSGSFGVSSEARASAPIMSIQASAEERTDVARVYEIVRADLEKQLLEFQTSAGVQPEDQTVLLQLVPPETIEQTRSSVVRAAAGIALLGLGFACLAAILFDLVAQQRKKRRSLRPAKQTPSSKSGKSTESDAGPEHESVLEPPMEASVK